MYKNVIFQIQLLHASISYRFAIKMAQMERSLTSYNDAKNYPRNVADSNLPPYALDAIGHQLNAQAPRLFTDESQAALDFLDLGSSAHGTFYVVSKS